MSQPDWSLVICGGGSGGHLFPALAVIEELQRQPHPPHKILFLTAERAIDQRILGEVDAEQISLPAVASHEFLRHPLRSIFRLSKAVTQARRRLKSLKRPVLIGTGGFGSLPGVLAGVWSRFPVILLEQNVIPGRATTLLARFAKQVCVSFPESRGRFSSHIPVVVTGNPVRRHIAELPGKHSNRSQKLLVLGGSQGAKALNEAMLQFVKRHRQQLAGWTIIHQTGASAVAEVSQGYQELGQPAIVQPFFDHMQTLYEQAELIVTRAGGTSLAEIACAALPAVIVPFPNSLRDHQRANGRYYEVRAAAVVVEQGRGEPFASAFDAAILQLISDTAGRRAMADRMQGLARPDAAKQVASIVRTLAQP